MVNHPNRRSNQPRRYIAIEHNSGYIWGDATAETPELACALIDLAADESNASNSWERVNPIRDTDGGYHLYVAPHMFPEIENGQDQAMIDLVQAECRHVGDFRPTCDRS